MERVSGSAGQLDQQPAGEIIHASTVSISGKAVVVTGPSGSGKSSLCLELLALGAGLIADDRTVLYDHVGSLWAAAPPNLPEAIEARGVGLIPITLAKPGKVVLVVDLGTVETERMPPRRNTSLCGHNVTLLQRSKSTHFASAVLLFAGGIRSD